MDRSARNPFRPGEAEHATCEDQLRLRVESGAPVYGLVRFIPCDCGKPECTGFNPVVLLFQTVVPMGGEMDAKAQRVAAAFVAHRFEGGIRQDLASEFGTVAPPPPGAPGKALVN